MSFVFSPCCWCQRLLIRLADYSLAADARFNRNIRAIATAAATVFQYKYVLDRRPEEIEAVHDRVAGWW